MTDEEKSTTMTFRTSPAVKDNIEELAGRVKDLYWKFSWRSRMRNCKTKSGLLHEVLSGNLSIQEIREKVSELEAADESEK